MFGSMTLLSPNRLQFSIHLESPLGENNCGNTLTEIFFVKRKFFTSKSSLELLLSLNYLVLHWKLSLKFLHILFWSLRSAYLRCRHFQSQNDPVSNSIIKIFLVGVFLFCHFYELWAAREKYLFQIETNLFNSGKFIFCQRLLQLMFSPLNWLFLFVNWYNFWKASFFIKL